MSGANNRLRRQVRLIAWIASAVLALAWLMGALQSASAMPCGAMTLAEPAPAKPVLPARKPVRVLAAGAVYRRQIEQVVSDLWGVQGSPARLAAQLHQESSFRPGVTSHAGAQGMAQFMPATARWIAQQYPAELGQFDPWDATQSIRAAAIYDKHLLAEHNSAATDCDHWSFALSAYNGGGTHLRREQRAAAAAGLDPKRWWGNTELHRTRSPANWRENRGYVQRILVDLEPAYIDAGWTGTPVCS